MKSKITTWLLASLFIAAGATSYSNVVENEFKKTRTLCTAMTISAIPMQTSTLPTVSIVHPTCTVHTGTITVTYPTGPGFNYSINDGPYQRNPVFSDLWPYSTYYVKVKDNNGTLYQTVAVDLIKPVRPKPPVVIASQPDCGENGGSLFVMSPLGSEFTYSINGIDYQTSPTFTGVRPGNYFVSVRNVNVGCSSKLSEIWVNQPPKDCAVAGIFHTSVNCVDYRNEPGEQLIDQFCYSSRAGKVTNVTPGKFFYYTFVTAPSESFCVDVVQTKSNPELQLFSIHQENQIKLYDAECTVVATGTQMRRGHGQVCITNAVPGNVYILSAKFDSKSIINGRFTGAAPIVQYTFESKINGVTLGNSATTIDLMPNCTSRITEQDYEAMAVTLAPNPSSNEFNVHITSESIENVTVNITDINGRFIKQIDADATDIKLGSDLSKGIYFIEVIQGDKRKTLRAIKL